MNKLKADFAVTFSSKEWEEVKLQIDEFKQSKDEYLHIHLSNGKRAIIDRNTVVINIIKKQVTNINDLLN